MSPLVLPDLLESTFTDADWLRVVHRLARARDVASVRLLLRIRFGPPGQLPVDDSGGEYQILLPARDGDERELYLAQHPELDDPPQSPDPLAALIDAAVTPADWATVLRWLARCKEPGAKRLLWAYRFGLRSVALPPKKHSGLIRLYDLNIPQPELATAQAAEAVSHARFLAEHPGLAPQAEASSAEVGMFE